MLNLSIDVSKKRRLLRGEHSIRIQVRLTPDSVDTTPVRPLNGTVRNTANTIPVARLFGELMEQLPVNLPLGQAGFTRVPATLKNLRGRSADAFHPSPPATLEKGSEELLTASGVVICPAPIGSKVGPNLARKGVVSPDVDSEDDDDTELPPGTETPFFVTLTTRFSEFDRGNGIVHQVVSRTSNILQSILPRLSSGALSRLAPLRLEKIRFGFESFIPRSWGFGLGGIPTASSHLYCELTESEMTIEATRDFSPVPEALPFAEEKLFQSFDRALSRLGLRQGFYEELMRNVAQS